MLQGLNSYDAAKKLKEFGYNELPSSKPKKVWHIAYEVIKEPMFLLLIGCAFLYMMLGDYKEGLILVATVFIIITITFYQSQKTERALESLKKLSSPRALVIRDGKEIRIPGREVVVDDLIILHEGDRVAADGILVRSNNLTIDESLLTGESVPVSKNLSINKNSSEKIFGSTLVVQGSGIIKITATGVSTEFGKIGVSLSTIEQDETRLQKEMKLLIRNLFIISVFISLALIVLFYINRGNFIQSLLNGLSASMALLPEEFPVVLTVFLALGSWRLSKQNILTRKPSAIETLGSATVLCSDKTGTITQNKMEVTAVYNGDKLFFQEEFITNKDALKTIFTASLHSSQIFPIDPMEKAIHSVNLTYNSGIRSDKLHLVKEFPLSKHHFVISRVFDENINDTYTIYSKGAPEAVLNLCALSSAEKQKHLDAVKKMAESGLRVIAVAKTEYEKENIPENQFNFKLHFLGLIGFEDPIRPEVPNAIQECRSAGIKVVMITGDYPVTAKSIAYKAGLDKEGIVMTGEELNSLTDEELKNRIENISVFARVIPEQKLRIISAFKSNNEIVAMTGDGVNDAPALKAADIGIAMGCKGTDVAREASSLVLLDDNFASIVSAIRLGRKIFDNLQKAMSYIVSIHIPIIGLTLIPAFFDTLPLLLMPLHIVFMELIIDPVCSVAFESEQEEKLIMNRPPRNPSDKFFGVKKILVSAFGGFLLFSMVLIVYLLSVKEGHSANEARAITFSALIIGNIVLILTSLSKTRSFVSVLFEKNFVLIFILLFAITLLCLINFIPALALLFSFESPGHYHFIPSVIGAFILLFIFETTKYINNQTSIKKVSA